MAGQCALKPSSNNKQALSQATETEPSPLKGTKLSVFPLTTVLLVFSILLNVLQFEVRFYMNQYKVLTDVTLDTKASRVSQGNYDHNSDSYLQCLEDDVIEAIIKHLETESKWLQQCNDELREAIKDYDELAEMGLEAGKSLKNDCVTESEWLYNCYNECSWDQQQVHSRILNNY